MTGFGQPGDAILAAIETGIKIIDLSQCLENGMPGSPNHPQFKMSLLRRHGDAYRADGSSAANELIVTGGHVGTHIDALAHVSNKNRLFGGHDCESAQRGGRFSVHGVDTILPIVGRCILLDIDLHKGGEGLPAGYGITRADVEGCAAAGGVEPDRGDVCLVRTGWAQNWTDPDVYLGQQLGAPGLTVEAAAWIADRGVIAIGADTAAVEQIPAGRGHSLLPVHNLLLVERGIYIVENLFLENLPHSQTSFAFTIVIAPLKIVGGTGSPVRPLAVLPR